MNLHNAERPIRIVLLLALLVLSRVFTSAGGSLDINNQLFVTTISVDKKDGEIWFYVEYANIEAGQSSSTGGSGSTGGDKYLVVKSHGKTISEARQNLDRQLTKPLFLGGIRTLVLTENFAKEHLVEYLYRLRADREYRQKIYTVITRDDPDALHKAVKERNESLGYSIEHTITSLEETGQGYTRSTSRLLENLSDPYTGILMPCIGLQDGQTALTGYSVVNDTKVIGFIPIEACTGLNIIKVDKAQTNYDVPYGQSVFAVETILTKRKVKAFYTDGKPAFLVSLSFDAKLNYGNNQLPYGLGDADIEALTALVKQMIEKGVQDAVFQAQNAFKTDYLQLDDAFRVAYPTAFRSMDWNEAFARATIATEVEVNLEFNQLMDYSVNELK